jgi:hypothetical protein
VIPENCQDFQRLLTLALNSIDCRNISWLLKKSIFLKTAEIWGIENVYEKRERRL